MDAGQQTQPTVTPTDRADLFRVEHDGRTLGTVFRNWQGWIAAVWREYPFSADASIHATRDDALLVFGVRS